jgi:hypothetical protein
MTQPQKPEAPSPITPAGEVPQIPAQHTPWSPGDFNRKASPLRTGWSPRRARASRARPAGSLLMTRASRGVSIAMVVVVGALFVILPDPDPLVTGLGTVWMVWQWNSWVRLLQSVAAASHRPATLVTQKYVGHGSRACVVDVSMEDGTVQRGSVHVDGKPPAEFLVALLPDGGIVRVSKNEQLGIPLMMFASSVALCALGLAGMGVVDLIQSSGG